MQKIQLFYRDYSFRKFPELVEDQIYYPAHPMRLEVGVLHYKSRTFLLDSHVYEGSVTSQLCLGVSTLKHPYIHILEEHASGRGFLTQPSE